MMSRAEATSRAALVAFLSALTGWKLAMMAYGVQPADFLDGVLVTLIIVAIVVFITIRPER